MDEIEEPWRKYDGMELACRACGKVFDLTDGLEKWFIGDQGGVKCPNPECGRPLQVPGDATGISWQSWPPDRDELGEGVRDGRRDADR
jgi:hypothetical protein